MKSTLLPILIILLFISSTTHAQKTDSISPIFLEGTTINVAGMKPGFKDLEIENKSVEINNVKYKTFSQQLHIHENVDLISRSSEMYFNDLNINKNNSELMVQIEMFEKSGKFMWKDAMPMFYSKPRFSNNRTAILWIEPHTGKLKIYNKNGNVQLELDKIYHYKPNLLISYVSFIKIDEASYYYGIAKVPGEIIWERKSKNNEEIRIAAFSENGYLVVNTDSTIYSYDPNGQLLWELPHFTSNMIINDSGNRLFSGYSTPKLIDNSNGKVIMSTSKAELNGIKVKNVGSKWFVKNSQHVVVYFYDHKIEKGFLAVINENGECINLKERRIPTFKEARKYSFVLQKTSGINILKDGEVIDEFNY